MLCSDDPTHLVDKGISSIALKIIDIDSTRMTLRIEQGNGHKDRYAMLSPVLLEHMRSWWHFAHRQRLMREGGWLFPGQNPVNSLTTRQLNRVCKLAAVEIGIEFTNTYGGIDSPFYSSMAAMYFDAADFINSHNMVNLFQERLYKMVLGTQDCGWGFHDSLVETYYDVINTKE